MLQVVRGSYPAKLLLAAVLVVAVTAGYAAVTAAETEADVREEARGELVTDTRQASVATGLWLDGVESRAQSAADAVTTASDPATGLERFAASHDRPPGIVGYGYAEDGEYVAGTVEGMAGATVAAPSADGVTGTYTVDWYENRVVALPVSTGDGTVVAVLDLHEFAQTLGPNSENLVIANGDREIVAHSDSETVGTDHREVGGTISSLSEGGDATSTVMGGRGMVMAFAPVDGAPWTLMIHEDTGSAFAVAGDVRSSLLGVLLVGLVGIVVVGATVGSSTVVSVRQLSRRAEQMAEGDLSVSLSTRRSDEFGDLYRSLATMRDDLRDRIEAAESAREEAQRAKREAEGARQDAESARERAESAREEAERERTEAEAFSESLRETATEYAEAMRAAAAGDLTRRLQTEDRADAMAEVGEEVNDMLGEIEATVSRLVEFAGDVRGTARQVESRTQEVQTASEQVAASVAEIQTGARDQDDSLEEVARELETLSASAEEIAATVDQAVETSGETASAAAAGEEAATDALDAMDDVVDTTAEASEAIEALDAEIAQIGEIVDVISDIAEETNMLALNASIEAARAGDGGDGGQGFGVVAEEVKSLSEETRASAAEIEERITAVQNSTGDAVETVGRARGRVRGAADTVEEALTELDRIASRVEETDRNIREISDVTADQADSAQEASRQIDAVAEISRETVAETDEVSAAADQQTDAADTVTAEVTDLREQADVLRDLLDQFTVSDTRATPSASGTARPSASTDGGRRGE